MSRGWDICLEGLEDLDLEVLGVHVHLLDLVGLVDLKPVARVALVHVDHAWVGRVLVNPVRD